MLRTLTSSFIKFTTKPKYFSTIKYYTESHEWINFNTSTNIAEIGISDHAQNELGDLVHLEIIKSGDVLSPGDAFCTLESVKGVSDAYVPTNSVVIEINEAAVEEPSKINDDAENCWIVKAEIKNAVDLEGLMDKSAYEKFIEN